MMDIEAHAYKTVLDDAIHERLVTRRWYREHLWAAWPDLRRENEVELRLLLALARKARSLARPERTDPITQAKGWTEGEKAVAWGR